MEGERGEGGGGWWAVDGAMCVRERWSKGSTQSTILGSLLRGAGSSEEGARVLHGHAHTHTRKRAQRLQIQPFYSHQLIKSCYIRVLN